MNADLSILIRKDHSTVTIISMYVDDLLIASKAMQEVNQTKAVLNRAFQMSNLGEAQIIIELRVIRD